MQALQEKLACPWLQGLYRLGQMVRFDREDGEVLITASITTSMTGHLPGILLAHSLPKGLDPCHEVLVLLVDLKIVRHSLSLRCRC
jgi:hypothetical protein